MSLIITGENYLDEYYASSDDKILLINTHSFRAFQTICIHLPKIPKANQEIKIKVIDNTDKEVNVCTDYHIIWSIDNDKIGIVYNIKYIELVFVEDEQTWFVLNLI